MQRLQQPQAVGTCGPIWAASVKTGVPVQAPAQLEFVGKVDRFEQIMLTVSQVFEREREECEHLLKSVEWVSDALDRGVRELECEDCGSALLQPDHAPGAAKDGGDTPYVACPECGEEAYVIGEGRCASCGHEAEQTCSVCGCEIPPEELEFSPLCGWCEHMASKDD